MENYPLHSPFKDKLVIVTGSSSGIGRAASVEFAKLGAKLALFDVDETSSRTTQELIEAAGSMSYFQNVDVSNAQQVKNATDNIVKQFGKIDFAFNNAGIEGIKAATYHEYPEDDWDQTININLKGIWLCMKYQLRQMDAQKHGAIVNTASMMGQIASSRNPAYTASKHGVVGLTKSAALAYAGTGIRVNAICPGFIHTEMVDRVVEDNPLTSLQDIEANCPMQRLGTPTEVAKAAAWLCSESASFITGQTLTIDGGFVIR